MNLINLGVTVTKINEENSRGDKEPKLPEPLFYRELTLMGKAHDINVYIFPAQQVDCSKNSLSAFQYKDNAWKKCNVPLPDIVYDRCFYANNAERRMMLSTLSSISQLKSFQHINSPLPSKLQVYDALFRVEHIIPYLPHTEKFVSSDMITKWLKLYPDGIILKPSSGMQGKGVMHIHYDERSSNYIVKGRTMRNQIFMYAFDSKNQLKTWLVSILGTISYLIQPYLSFRNDENCPFDIRVLMQKNISGKWQLTGSVARVGSVDSLTSNLHGGGMIQDVSSILQSKLGKYKSERLLEEIHMISEQTAVQIEQNFGRFGELAFDFGVENNGRLWLLECNSKPGRSAFRNMNQPLIKTLSIEQPLLYAKYLYERQFKRLNG